MMNTILWALGLLGGFGMLWKLLIGKEAWAIHAAFSILRTHPAFMACLHKYSPEIKQALDILHDETIKEVDAA